jgi:hypothetical protein
MTEEPPVTEELPLAVKPLVSVTLLVTVVLLVNDLVTVDVVTAEVGSRVEKDSVDTDPLPTDDLGVAIVLLVTTVLWVTVLLPVAVGLPGTVVLLVTGLDTVYIRELEMAAEESEDWIDTVSYTMVVLVPGTSVVVVKLIFVNTASSLPVHAILPVKITQELKDGREAIPVVEDEDTDAVTV